MYSYGGVFGVLEGMKFWHELYGGNKKAAVVGGGFFFAVAQAFPPRPSLTTLMFTTGARRDANFMAEIAIRARNARTFSCANHAVLRGEILIIS